MKSIFDLKTKNSDLSSANQGLSNYKYQEIQSLRSVVGNNFGDGEIVYRWTFGSNKYWIPNKSYIKIRLKLTFPGGTPIAARNHVTWAMNTVPQMFQSCQYKISDQTVCSVTQNLAQVDSLKNRMYRSGDWLQTVGQTMNNMDPRYLVRERALLDVGGQTTSPFDVFKSWATIRNEAGINDTSEIQITVLQNGNWSIILSNGGDFGDIKGLQKGDVCFILGMTTIFETIFNSAIIVNPGKSYIEGKSSPNNTLFDAPVTVDEHWLHDPLMSFARGDYFNTDHADYAHRTELFWQPTLSVFDSVKHAIPCASTKHELTLTPFPESTWQKHVIESRSEEAFPSDTLQTDRFKYEVEVEDMRFYILTCDSNRIDDNFEFMLDLNEIQCQRTPITTNNQQQSLDVIPSTNGISLAFQDQLAGNSTLYSLSKFVIRDNLEMQLNRYYIRYEGQVPQPDFEGSWEREGTNIATADTYGKVDHLRELYVRTKMYDGTLFLSQPETLADYRSRGMYVYHPFPKTASSRNTRVYVQTNFTSLEGNVPFMLLFSHYKKAVVLTVQNGRIIDVKPFDA